MTLRNRIPNEERRALLKNKLNKGLVRVLEVHNGISAIIANDTNILNGNGKIEFDALWISSLTDSAAKGYPDIEIVSYDSRIDTINQILDVTNKPIIVDGDTGGDFNTFEYLIKRLERVGVSAVIIEDKVYPKRNSLDDNSIQNLEKPEVFATKIKRGKAIQTTKEFMIIARLESLISGESIKEAIKRARIYLEAGADGIMIHSKSKTPTEILEFAKEYHKLCQELNIKKPLVCVPTTYNIIKEKELIENGFNVVIYANHLLRSAHKAMKDVAISILENSRSLETDPYCSSVNEIFEHVGFTDIKKKDEEELEKLRLKLKIIIPAAGETSNELKQIADVPVPMLKIGDKTIIERQLEKLRKIGLKDHVIIRGYKKDLINMPNVKYYDTDNTKLAAITSSLFTAEKEFDNGFIMIYSDILFDESIIEDLIKEEGDIIIVVDDSYKKTQNQITRRLDLVTTKNKQSVRGLKKSNNVVNIGQKVSMDIADYEFIGIALLTKTGVENLKKVYYDCLQNHKGRFHEAESIKTASFTDLLQEMINRGFKVSTFEVHKGWLEIHDLKDYKIATEEFKE